MTEKRNPFIFLVLYPFSILYGFVVVIRNLLFDWGLIPSRQFRKTIISIGNLTTGGTGKTPHAEYLVDLLKDEFSVAFLSRGYKRKTRGFILAGENTSAEEIGDEPAQVKNKYPGIIVAVSEKRVRGIERITELFPEIDVIILDDAFQHRYVEPGLSLLLFDFNRNTYADSLLPAGNLREPFSSKRRADILVITKAPTGIKPIEKRLQIKNYTAGQHQAVYFSSLNYGKPKFVFENGKEAPDLDEIKQKQYSILLVTGIAYPEPLVDFLERRNIKLSHLAFPDHYSYSEGDLVKILDQFEKIEAANRLILTTEKDATRFKKFANIAGDLMNVMAFLPVQIAFSEKETLIFNQQILNYVRTSKRDSIFYSKQNKY